MGPLICNETLVDTPPNISERQCSEKRALKYYTSNNGQAYEHPSDIFVELLALLTKYDPVHHLAIIKLIYELTGYKWGDSLERVVNASLNPDKSRCSYKIVCLNAEDMIFINDVINSIIETLNVHCTLYTTMYHSNILFIGN